MWSRSDRGTTPDRRPHMGQPTTASRWALERAHRTRFVRVLVLVLMLLLVVLVVVLVVLVVLLVLLLLNGRIGRAQ